MGVVMVGESARIKAQCLTKHVCRQELGKPSCWANVTATPVPLHPQNAQVAPSASHACFALTCL